MSVLRRFDRELPVHFTRTTEHINDVVISLNGVQIVPPLHTDAGPFWTEVNTEEGWGKRYCHKYCEGTVRVTGKFTARWNDAYRLRLKAEDDRDDRIASDCLRAPINTIFTTFRSPGKPFFFGDGVALGQCPTVSFDTTPGETVRPFGFTQEFQRDLKASEIKTLTIKVDASDSLRAVSKAIDEIKTGIEVNRLNAIIDQRDIQIARQSETIKSLRILAADRFRVVEARDSTIGRMTKQQGIMEAAANESVRTINRLNGEVEILNVISARKSDIINKLRLALHEVVGSARAPGSVINFAALLNEVVSIAREALK